MWIDILSDFDPFFETQKGLAELIENELMQQQTQSNQPTKMMDNSTPRSRLPPPGFSHMNAFGLGVPRAPTQTSKILPFMNNGNGSSSQTQQSNWAHHPIQQPQQNMNFGMHDQMGPMMPKQNHQNNKNGKHISPPSEQHRHFYERFVRLNQMYEMVLFFFFWFHRFWQRFGLVSDGSSYCIIPSISTVIYVWATTTIPKW